MRRFSKSSGFTLVELMLAMAFVSVLLLAVAMTVLQIANIYNRGMTLTDVNQAGRSLASEIQQSVNGSMKFAITGVNNHFVKYDWGGRLCIGQYSYIWNYGKNIKSDNNGVVAGNNTYAGNPNTTIRFVKVYDSTAEYCSNVAKTIDLSSSVELLSISEHNLAVHSFNITSNTSDDRTGQQLYYIQFFVGTNDQNALKANPSNANDKICKAPGDAGSDFAYCAVNEFNVIARAGNIAK